jgi:hypothetical protein
VSVRTRTLRFTSSAKGTARVVLARRTTGRKVRGHCVRRTAANRHRHSCTRWVTVRSLRVAARAGANRVVLPRKALRRGRYRVQVRVVAGDHASKTVARSLAVITDWS